MTRDMLALRMNDEDWQAVLDVDLTAPFRLARAALRGMLRRRAGRIINISSIVGATGNPGQANYAAAKAGLVGMTQGAGAGGRLARHHGQCGGARLRRHADDRRADRGAAREADRRAIPLGRLGRPEDVAAAVVYLATDEAGWVTGATLHVNGGMAML